MNRPATIEEYAAPIREPVQQPPASTEAPQEPEPIPPIATEATETQPDLPATQADEPEPAIETPAKKAPAPSEAKSQPPAVPPHPTQPPKSRSEPVTEVFEPAGDAPADAETQPRLPRVEPPAADAMPAKTAPTTRIARTPDREAPTRPRLRREPEREETIVPPLDAPPPTPTAQVEPLAEVEQVVGIEPPQSAESRPAPPAPPTKLPATSSEDQTAPPTVLPTLSEQVAARQAQAPKPLVRPPLPATRPPEPAADRPARRLVQRETPESAPPPATIWRKPAIDAAAESRPSAETAIRLPRQALSLADFLGQSLPVQPIAERVGVEDVSITDGEAPGPAPHIDLSIPPLARTEQRKATRSEPVARRAEAPSLPAGIPVVQRSVEQRPADAPTTTAARESHAGSPTEQAESEEQAPERAGPVDVDAMAREVYQILRRRLRVERERAGAGYR